MPQFPFIKVEATGNDFLIVDLLTPEARDIWRVELGALPRPDLVKRVSDRHFGLGADGVVFLEPAEGFDFEWDFYNNDGGSAEMCGNAARAVSLYVQKSYGKSELKFKTRVGLVLARVRSPSDIEVELPAIRAEIWGESFDFVNSGVPHALVKWNDLREHAQMRERALEIKRRPEFAKDGTNVTFLNVVAPGKIESITFERGVEDFTLACGTGAIAAAHSVLRGNENQNLEVTVPGGTLHVVFKEGRPHLSGPARVVGRMNWIKE